MIRYYLKVAWRNLLKYRTQSIISVLGLAIGFTAFSFTISWIRYENSYDKHNPYADQIFKIVPKDSKSGIHTSVGLTEYLRTNFPEVIAASNVYSSQLIFPENITLNQRSQFVKDCRFSVSTDTAFFSVFYPEVEISYPVPLPVQATVVVKSLAEKWDITLLHINTYLDSLSITPIAIIDDYPVSSNVAFRYLNVSNPMEGNLEISSWNHNFGYTYIRINEAASIENISNILENLEITEQDGTISYHSYKVIPLRKAHYLHSNYEDVTVIKFEALKQFSIVSLLVIFCALINYIMLFSTRVKIRTQEFSLNKINGASFKNIIQLLFWEFIIILFTSIFIGIILTELLFPLFSRFSLIVASKSYFLIYVLLYSLLIILATTGITFIVINSFVRNNIHYNLHLKIKADNKLKVSFSNIAIFVQICIGILLIFSSTVMYNQYNLIDQRVGYNRNNLMVFGTNNNNIPIAEIKSIPEIGDFITNTENLFTWSQIRRVTPTEIIDEEQKSETHNFIIRFMNIKAREFLEIPLLEGRDILPEEQSAYYINESGNRLLENNALGKLVRGSEPIIGVIPDLQVESPLIKIVPTLYGITRSDDQQMCRNITFRAGNDSIKKIVFDWFSKKFPLTEGTGFSYYTFYLMDINEIFKDFTKSERYLLFLLLVMTGVAILISVFGIYSMVTLACNRRRKEIAIRKVNGASIKEIFMLFFRQYLWITIAASAVAFPLGVFVMQRWLEQYTRRVAMEWWLFAGVFALVLLIVMVSMIFRVTKAARENPAEVVKSE